MDANKALEVMNRAFSLSPAAINSLVSNRVPCDGLLTTDKSVICGISDISGKIEFPTVGLLGILNGILLECGSKEVIAAIYDMAPGNRNVLKGFCLAAVDEEVK